MKIVEKVYFGVKNYIYKKICFLERDCKTKFVDPY
jgi:hypothetical protein